MANINIRKGNTFTITCTVSDSSGAPVDISTWTIQSQVRSGTGILIAQMTVAITSATTFTLTTDTSNFPGGSLVCDIVCLNSASQKISSDVFNIIVSSGATAWS